MAAKTIAERKGELIKTFEEVAARRGYHEDELQRLTQQMLRLQGAQNVLDDMEREEQAANGFAITGTAQPGEPAPPVIPTPIG